MTKKLWSFKVQKCVKFVCVKSYLFTNHVTLMVVTLQFTYKFFYLLVKSDDASYIHCRIICLQKMMFIHPEPPCNTHNLLCHLNFLVTYMVKVWLTVQFANVVCEQYFTIYGLNYNIVYIGNEFGDLCVMVSNDESWFEQSLIADRQDESISVCSEVSRVFAKHYWTISSL